MPKDLIKGPKSRIHTSHLGIHNSARGIAIKILRRIDEKNAYCSILLTEALKNTSLSPQDKRLTTILVYGVLRYKNQLDWYIEQVATRPLSKISAIIKDILRSSAYQLLYLNRIPAAAIINEAVNLARHYSHRGTMGFVNAVLRRLQQKIPTIHFPDEETDPVRHISLRWAHPEWIIRRWIKQYGINECKELCNANNQQPRLSIRLNSLKAPVEEIFAYLARELQELLPSEILTEGVFVEGPRPLMATSSYHKGYFEIQGLSSMLPGRILDPQPGEVILDACAGRGGKTTHLAQLMKNQGTLFALDLFAHKLHAQKKISQRLYVKILQKVCGNIQAYPFRTGFDRVLVDAPCSSLGILRRHPEIKWRKSESDLVELSSLQLNILANSSHLLKPDGILVYSVCSFEPEETTRVLERFLDQNPGFRQEDLSLYIDKSLYPAVGKDGYLRIYPHLHGMDGFFVARLRKK